MTIANPRVPSPAVAYDGLAGRSRLSQSRTPRLCVQVAAGLSGAAAWGCWWVASSRLSPQAAFGLWLLALFLFASAFFSPWALRRPTRTTGWAFVTIAVMMLPRVWSIEWAPYHVTLDEIVHPVCGLEVLRQRPWDIMSGVSGYFATPFLTQVLQAWPCLLLDPLVGARLASVILAVASLLSTYALASSLFGRGAGLAAVVVLSCSAWHMAYSRLAYPYMQPILLLPLTLHVLLRGVSEHHRFLQLAGGLLLGLSLLAYTPARIVIPIFLAWFGHRIVTRVSPVRNGIAALAVIALGALLAISPYVHRQGLAGVWARYRDTSMGPSGPLHRANSAGWTSAATWKLFGDQFQSAARPYYSTGAEMAVSNRFPAPLFDPLSLALTLAGLAIAVVRFRDGRCFLLVVWIAATFTVGQVLTDIPASAYRAAPLLPAVAICAGLSASRIMAFTRVRWAPWRRPLPQAATVLAALAVILPLNLQSLVRYLTGSHDPWSQMARLIAAGDRKTVYYLVSGGPAAEHDLFRFLGDGRRVRDVSSLMDALGRQIDPRFDALFVLAPGMTAAASAIQRCYPGAAFASSPGPEERQPALGLLVPQPAVAAGRDCLPSATATGLRARYFSGAGWDGEVVRQQIEDWPVRWSTHADITRFGSIEWAGSVRLPVAGTYRFQLLADGAAASAEVGGRVVAVKQEVAGAFFEAGTYPLRIRCQTIPGTLCWLRWAPPGGDFDAIPSEFLSPRGDSDGPPPHDSVSAYGSLPEVRGKQ